MIDLQVQFVSYFEVAVSGFIIAKTVICFLIKFRSKIIVAVKSSKKSRQGIYIDA
jgi:hypothetical protein